jgi:hypothetical protein
MGYFEYKRTDRLNKSEAGIKVVSKRVNGVPPVFREQK